MTQSPENDVFVDADGAGDLTIWRNDPDRPGYPRPIVRECDVSAEAWLLLTTGVAAGRALSEWDSWNPFHGSFREAARELRRQIDRVISSAACACGHPADDHDEGGACLHLCDCAWPIPPVEGVKP